MVYAMSPFLFVQMEESTPRKPPIQGANEPEELPETPSEKPMSTLSPAQLELDTLLSMNRKKRPPSNASDDAPHTDGES